MCGIAGSTSPEEAYKLYKSNFDRGMHSTGMLLISEKHFDIYKTEGVFTEEQFFANIKNARMKPVWILTHTRAPTNSDRPYCYNTTHPFIYNNTILAHNGIITNTKDFNFSWEVDSQIIARVYDTNGVTGLSQLKGLFTCWSYNIRDNTISVFKAGSSLFMSASGQSFCTTNFSGGIEVNDGEVFSVNLNELPKMILTAKFNYKNPYFIP